MSNSKIIYKKEIYPAFLSFPEPHSNFYFYRKKNMKNHFSFGKSQERLLKMPFLFLKRRKNKKITLNDFVAAVDKKITPVIKEALNSFAPEKHKEILNYQIDSGGKKIRPALAILSALACEGKIKDALYPAAGLEILHNYSLIIDDIIDDSRLRRNRPTLWAKFGRSVAECVSVDYAATVFQTAGLSLRPAKILEIFAKTMKVLVDGEILDVFFELKKHKDESFIAQNRNNKITIDDYLEIVKKKTAVFTQACCEIGGICANASAERIEHLGKFGFNLGLAAQIQDDILDIFGEKEKTGKEVGGDIRQGKRSNLVILLATGKLSKDRKKIFCRIMNKNKITDKDVKTAISLISQTDSRAESCKLGKKFIEKAKRELTPLPRNKWIDILKDLADFVIERDR